MVKLKGLGRGLDALLGGENSPPRASSADAVTTLPIAALQPGKYQPRSRMDQDALNALAASIKAQGIMQPILVRPVAGGNHEIIAGERRWRAARIAGLSNVPVLIWDVPDQQALAVALIENIQREDLNALEEATGIERLINEFSLTHQAVADAIGKSRATVTNLLRLLELPPPVRELMVRGQLEMGHGRALLVLPPERQIALAREAAAGGWSVREVERRVGLALNKNAPDGKKTERKDRDVARLEDDLSGRLGTTVQIKTGKRTGSGQLLIAYRTLEQLDDLLARFK